MPLLCRKFILISSCLFFSMLLSGIPSAQEDTYVLAHHDVFVKRQKPAVHFPHALHEDALSAEGCGACHHIFDERTRQLVYSEGDEQECNSCHGLKKVATIPALREAYHKSCTGCHRLKKHTNEKSGPTTCGECHQKK